MINAKAFINVNLKYPGLVNAASSVIRDPGARSWAVKLREHGSNPVVVSISHPGGFVRAVAGRCTGRSGLQPLRVRYLDGMIEKRFGVYIFRYSKMVGHSLVRTTSGD